MRIAAGKTGDHLLDIADRGWFARRTVERMFGRKKQIFGVKARREAFQPHRRDIPVAITARAFQQIKLFDRAVVKSQPQFTQQVRIISCSCCQGGVKGSGFIDHAEVRSCNGVKAGFILSQGVVSVCI